MKEARMLREGKVGVIPTDTLYALAASASHEQAVERVFALKGRATTKPCIILISSLTELDSFAVLSQKQHEIISRYWPGPTSIILPCKPQVPDYLHRGLHTLAFRLSNDANLNTFLAKSGPLIAPSANPEGLPPATTIEEAKKYFDSTVDFYIYGGKKVGDPSTLISLENDIVQILRKGRL